MDLEFGCAASVLNTCTAAAAAATATAQTGATTDAHALHRCLRLLYLLSTLPNSAHANTRAATLHTLTAAPLYPLRALLTVVCELLAYHDRVCESDLDESVNVAHAVGWLLRLTAIKLCHCCTSQVQHHCLHSHTTTTASVCVCMLLRCHLV